MHKEEPQKILLFSHNMNLSHAECYGMKLVQFHQQSPCNSLLARIKCNNFLLTVKTEVFGHDTTQLDISLLSSFLYSFLSLTPLLNAIYFQVLLQFWSLFHPTTSCHCDYFFSNQLSLSLSIISFTFHG